ncbi:MAG TPA: glycosyltransferase [Pyrinomonadaceae bacterium]|jgi:UDP:flavonoid glycosyltransferase YjiC (YdhE family)
MSQINQLDAAGRGEDASAGANVGANPAGKRIVLTTFGSFGDVHPYIAVGLELKARGHQAVIATSPLYREKIEATGLGFHPIRPDFRPPQEEPELVAKVMDVRKGSEFLFKDLLMPHLRDGYEDLREAASGADLLITHVITFAGPILAQKTGIPWISTVLAPTSFFSAYDPFVPPQSPGLVKLLRLSPLLARGFASIVKGVSDKWVEPVYQLRAELGLPRGGHPIFEGQHSPSLVLALFSKVLGEPQPDWPPQTVVTGFPFFDRKDIDGKSEADLAPELKKFLDGGPAPVVFTLGSSAVFVAEDFYRESAAAARTLKRRAVLLIGDERNRPKEPLPDDLAVFEYAPYGQILPHAAAVVHQGGVGTTGQALRAGVPTLIVPFNHDQPDNAARVERLGVGRTLARKKYATANVVRELDRLLGDETYAERAAAVGEVVRGEDGARTAADEIERFALKL